MHVIETPIASKSEQNKTALPANVAEWLNIGPRHELALLAKFHPDLKFAIQGDRMEIVVGASLSTQDITSALKVGFDFSINGNTLTIKRLGSGRQESNGQVGSASSAVVTSDVFRNASFPLNSSTRRQSPCSVETSTTLSSKIPKPSLVSDSIDGICQLLNWSGVEAQFLRQAANSGVLIKRQSLDRANADGFLELKNVDSYSGGYRKLLRDLRFIPQGDSPWCCDWQRVSSNIDCNPDKANVAFINATTILIHYGSMKGVGGFIASGFSAGPESIPE